MRLISMSFDGERVMSTKESGGETVVVQSCPIGHAAQSAASVEAAAIVDGAKNAAVPRTRNDFVRHLRDLGVLVGATLPELTNERLRIMGPKRFEHLDRLIEADIRGVHSPGVSSSKYVGSFQEANLLLLPITVEEVNWALYNQVQHCLKPGMSVVDLGCGTGLLASFIAKNHSGCLVTGMDRIRNIHEMTRAKHQQPNLTFELRDYTRPHQDLSGQYDVLMCGMGLEFSAHVLHNGIDPHNCRTSSGYRQYRSQTVPCFKSWHGMARPGATLITVLRLYNHVRGLAVADAAHAAGWELDLGQSRWLNVDKLGESHPLWVFRYNSGPVDAVKEIDVLDFWTQPDNKSVSRNHAAALKQYRALSPRSMHRIATHKYRNGHEGYREVGLAGEGGYALVMHSMVLCKLEFLSADKVDSYPLDDNWTLCLCNNPECPAVDDRDGHTDGRTDMGPLPLLLGV
jgi:SAM-dependent methyltransferase